MSQENVEIVRRATEGFNDSGVESLLSYCDPSITWHTTGEFPDSGVYEGRESVRRGYEEMEADLDRVRYEIEEVRGAGDWVVVTGRMTGLGRIAGVPFERPLAFATRLHKGRYVEVRQFVDPADAYRAAGLAE
jgi:ketosteroid isomerase-like protein